jgi:hypothetical protein
MEQMFQKRNEQAADEALWKTVPGDLQAAGTQPRTI